MDTTHAKGSYAPVNGLKLYYERHGEGEPLIMIPGGLQTVAAFGALVSALAETRQVIAVELQGHGHTADIARPMHYERMADDIAALIAHLGLEHADVFGYSLGGGVALQAAIRHPDIVRKLVVTSAVYASGGWYPETRAGMAMVTAELAATWVGSPMHEAYARVAPEPEGWTALAAKVGEMVRQEYDWTAGVAALPMPTLIIVGDADGIHPAHAVEMFGLLGGGKADGAMGGQSPSQLAVLPGTTHFSIIERTDLLMPIIAPFLDAPMPEGK